MACTTWGMDTTFCFLTMLCTVPTETRTCCEATLSYRCTWNIYEDFFEPFDMPLSTRFLLILVLLKIKHIQFPEILHTMIVVPSCLVYHGRYLQNIWYDIAFWLSSGEMHFMHPLNTMGFYLVTESCHIYKSITIRKVNTIDYWQSWLEEMTSYAFNIGVIVLYLTLLFQNNENLY